MNPQSRARSSRGSVRRIHRGLCRRSRCSPFRSGRMRQKGATRRELPRLLLSSMYAICPLRKGIPQPASRCQIWDEMAKCNSQKILASHTASFLIFVIITHVETKISEFPSTLELFLLFLNILKMCEIA